MTDDAADLHSPEAKEFLAACRNRLQQVETLLATLTAPEQKRTLANTAAPANAIGIHLDWVASMAGLYQSVHPDSDVRRAAEIAEQEASRLSTELSLNRAFFEAVSALPEAGLDPAAKRWRAHTLRDFRRSGVDRDETARNRIRALNETLVTVSQDFAKHIREDVRQLELSGNGEADLKGLPADYIDKVMSRAKKDGKPPVVTTDYPDYVPFMTYAENEDLRRQLYVLNRQRGYPENVAVLGRMIEARHELAHLLGFESWADYVTETRMIKHGKAVHAFIDRIAALSEGPAARDYAMLLEQKRALGDKAARAVNEWERAFLEEIVKRQRFHFNAQDVRPYFEYTRVKDGVLRTCERLFACSFERREEAAWHKDVETYDVRCDGKLVGRFQLDMHPRKDKYKHAAQFTRQSGVRGEQIPIGVLVCNFPDPHASPDGALMEHKDVVTFFHEFGHLMHHIFGGDQPWVRMSGVATEWDFVEAPSQMLEEWAWDHDVLATFAKHYKTGQAIPAELTRKMRAADEFAKGIQARVQMFYAAVSLAFFSREPKSVDPTALLAELQARYSPFAYVPGTHFHLSFGHLDGYSAGYYTYMWSLVIAKDLFSAFEKNGLMHHDTAVRYRDLILAQGGAEDAATLIERFLGRPYAFDAFEKWLKAAA